MKRLMILSLALILILSACSGAILDSAEKELEYTFDGILVGFEMPDILSESDYMRFSIYENNE